jgi:lipopolysaccharide heptosyltransferase II
MGDIILTTPLIRSVRKSFPNAKITYLVKKEFADLVKHNPYLNEVIIFDKHGGLKALMDLRKQISAGKYDWFIDLHNNLRTRFLRISLHFGSVSTYHKDSLKRMLLVRWRINLLRNGRQIFLKYFDAIARHSIQYDGQGTEVLLPEAVINKVKAKLSIDSVSFHKPIILLCPGASFSNKRWLPERFQQLGEQLINSSGYQVIFLGGPTDKALCQEIVSNMQGKALNYAGEFSLLESAALASLASAVVTNDSGMMHLAQSQGSPVVAIFGPTSKELGFYPIPGKSQVIEKDISCRPCTTKGLEYCPKKHFNCMKQIEAEEVYHAIQRIIS